MIPIPLFPDINGHTPFALRGSSAISQTTFRTQVSALASALPAEGRVLNMCADRYWFSVALFAAITRGLMTVLPSSAAPEHIASLSAQQPGLLVLGDQPVSPVSALPYLKVDTVRDAIADASLQNPFIPYDQPVACLYTSGSTGAPTVHYKTFGRLRRSSLGGAERLWGVAGGACSVVGTVPIRHMYGLEFSVLLPILGGGLMSTQIPFFPADIVTSLEEVPEPRLLVITPFHLRKLVESGISLPRIAAVLSATAPLPIDLAQQTERQLGCAVIEIYGSTETGQLATRQPAHDATWHTVNGSTIEMRDGEAWAIGEVYETPQLLNDTLELLSPTAFRLVDRKANMVNVAGKRSSLSFLNAALCSLQGVQDGAFCLPERGTNSDVERLAAFVVAPTLNREAILSGLKAHVDPVFLPRPIVFVESLPRDGNGKLPAHVLDALISTHITRRA